MSCLVKRYENLYCAYDYNGRHFFHVNSKNERFIVYHHLYSCGKRYGRSWVILQLDCDYNIMPGEVWCYDDALYTILECYNDIDMKQHPCGTVDVSKEMIAGKGSSKIMGYHIEARKHYYLYREKYYKVLRSPIPIAMPDCEVDIPSEFEQSWSTTTMIDCNIKVASFSDIDHVLILHIHEQCQKIL